MRKLSWLLVACSSGLGGAVAVLGSCMAETVFQVIQAVSIGTATVVVPHCLMLMRAVDEVLRKDG